MNAPGHCQVPGTSSWWLTQVMGAQVCGSLFVLFSSTLLESWIRSRAAGSWTEHSVWYASILSGGIDCSVITLVHKLNFNWVFFFLSAKERWIIERWCYTGMALWYSGLNHGLHNVGISHGCWLQSQLLHFSSTCLLICLGKQQKLTFLGPCIHTEDLEEAPVSWLQLGSALDFQSIRGVKHQMEGVLSVSTFLCNSLSSK